MSDFLTRLAQLTRGEATVVNPRLPGRFDPLPETIRAETGLTGFEQHSQRVTDGNPGRRQSPAVSDENHLSPGAAAAKPVDRRSGEEPDRSRSEVSQTLKSAGQPGKAAAHSPLIIPAPTQADRAPATALTGAGVKLAEPAAGSTGKAGELSAKLLDRGRESTTRQSLGIAKPGKPAGPASASRVDPLPLVTVIRDQPGKPQSAAAATEQPVFKTTASKHEPAVHIHIGRIEVRAHAPVPSTAQRPARPKPESSLKLQDYLKRGHSGSSRS
jgi:hypothetical protein